MADRQDASRRGRPDRPDRQDRPDRSARPERTDRPERPSRPSSSRRSDVVRCEKCGEDYSVTYKRCPFCDERPNRGGVVGKRVANTRGGGYGRPVNPVQIVGLVVSLVLIIAALYIIFTKVGPLLRPGGKPGGSSSSAPGTSQSQPGGDISQPGGDVSQPGGTVSTPEPGPTVIRAEAISLSKQDITLEANGSFQITAAVAPTGVTEPIEWSSSDPSIATVDADGKVVNVNRSGAKKTVTITASCSGLTAECIVRCNSAAGGTAASGSTGVVTAKSGLNIRSGPGPEYDKVASAPNGAKVTILEDAGNGWYKIEYSAGKTGYASADYVSVSP